MRTQSQAGFVSGTLISLIVTIVLLVSSLGFGAWAFMSRQDYKNNSDQKAEAAADERQEETEAADAVKYAEEAKNPLKTHKGPDQYGGLMLSYPKTWSGYVSEDGGGSAPVNDYFHPGVVPSSKDTAYALRIEVVDQPYDRVIDSFRSEVEGKKLSSSPYSLPKVASVVGTRLDGEVEPKKQGSMVVLPIRNMTLKVWTESRDYVPDFNNIILANFTFSP